ISRKSTIAIEPITSVNASTCTHSIHGNRLSPSRIAVAIAVSCTNCRNCSNTSRTLNVRDPSPREDNGDPQRHGSDRNQPCAATSGGGSVPEGWIVAQRQLAGQSHPRGDEQQSHFQHKHRVLQRARGLGND